MNEKESQFELMHRYLSGAATQEEAQALEALILQDASVRREFLRYAHLDAALAGNHRPAVVGVPSRSARNIVTEPLNWLSWRPLMAAAAGIVLGIFCTSVVFAYVAPSLGKVITVLQESFESGPAPLVTGAPMEAGHWSGDFTEVVDEQQGVRPESGKKMLRFLRTHDEGKPNAEGSHFGAIYRLIDMRPYRGEFADGGAVAQLSAGFNTLEFPASERYDCTLTLYALDAESVKNGSKLVGIRPDEGLLGVQKIRMQLDRSPGTWQRRTSELRLPPDTDFLLIRICIQYAVKSAARQTFAGHYLDDVRLTMARRNLLP